MKTNYIKETLLFIFCAFLLIATVNVVLLTSSDIGKAAADIIYLNFLLVTIAVLLWILGYIRFKRRYENLKDALDKGENIDYYLPQDDSFYSILLRDSIKQKNHEQMKSVATYKNSMDELNDYIIRWAHEIKIPVSVCELILENSDLNEAEAPENLRIELERIKFLINQVLYAGRAAYYNEDLSVSEFNLEKTVKQAVRRNARFFISKNMEVCLGILDFNVVNDEKWVSYILDQILNNASKYTRPDGRVEIHADEDGNSVRLHIKDNGIGIAGQDINRIFDKGFTGENGHKAAKSTGMGLYYSKKMADKLGIGLEVYSKAMEYTEFVLVFYKISDFFKV